MMANFKYHCTECGRHYSREDVRYLCPECGHAYHPGIPLRGVLEAEFDYDVVRRRFNVNAPDWSLLCTVETEFHPTFPVGNTPLVKVPRLGAALGYHQLFVKNDGLNPSGSLKDRASHLVVAEAIRLKEERIVTASTGNAAAALAAVCAAAGKRAVIFVPEHAPRAKLAQVLAHGAQVIRVRGTYDDAFRLSLEYTERFGGLNRNTAYHPLTIEGKKTVALEIAAQSNFRAPDAVIIPVGDGVILGGVFKGFRDLLAAGLIEKLPRLIAVQAETSDAIHHFITTGHYSDATAPHTIADSISVRTPSNAFMAKRAVEASNGFSLTVSDDEIRKGQQLLARTTGIFAEPAAAATVAALSKITEAELDHSSNIVLLITGHGLKDVDAALAGCELPAPIEPNLDAIT
jgi:threonine synthase